MQLRPCIDIHNGKVKQIVGGTLTDREDFAKENFVSEKGAAHFASLFRQDGLRGGHIILLNGRTSPYYEATRQMALQGLHAWPGGLMIGGGINDENAAFYLDEGASHVIVTSFVFFDGRISPENIRKMQKAAGKKRLCLDLSCRKKDGEYYIATDRWQKLTKTPLDAELLKRLSGECDEFLIHGIDSEGKSSGLDWDLIALLDVIRGFPMTYAGGISSFEDIRRLRQMTGGEMDFTIGSALSIYGGAMDYQKVISCCSSSD